MSNHIVVVGSINLDLVATAERIPRPGETIAGHHFDTFFGGKGANQAVAIAKLGHPVTMIGKVGSDAFGPQLRAALQAAGVEVSEVGTAEGSSGVALIATTDRGENSIIVVPGANAELTPADIDRCRERIQSAAMVLTQLEIGMATILRLSELTAASGVPLMLDPAPATPLCPDLLKRVDWISPNETETLVLLGTADGLLKEKAPPVHAEQLLARGPKNVVLKLGERGAFVADFSGNRTQISPFVVEAVDTTAAGDAFNGAFAVGLVNGKSPVEAAQYAAAVSAISVTRKGAQPSMPTAAEVERFLKERVMVKVKTECAEMS